MPTTASEMNIVARIADVRSAVAAARRAGRRIAFVPTMGALHAGHAALVRAARRASGFVVVSVFVNPTQFGPKEDFARYPRTLPADQKLCTEAGAHLIFAPSPKEMYPEGFSTWVEVKELDRELDGPARPGHFRGVCTVVAKLFHLLSPDAAVFGEKDFQQLAIIRRMVRDLNFPIEIIGAPTVREADGLACSSRNRYLSPSERQQAPVLQRGLQEARRLVAQGERSPEAVLAAARRVIEAAPLARIDYLEIVNAGTLQTVTETGNDSVIVVAAFFGQTRLIDNLRFS